MSASARNRLRKSSRSRNINHPFGWQASHFSLRMPGHVDVAPKKVSRAKSGGSVISKTVRKIGEVIGK